MKRLWIMIALFTLLGVGTAPAFAQVDYSSRQLENPVQEKQAKDLMDSIRCVVCQGQAISGSNADMAADMRSMIRERIKAGEKPEDIRAWLIQHYGDWVSFKPQLTSYSMPLWIIPFLAFLAGILLIRGRLKRR
jgi:cytochrome c-type biogenesis protein CcmH